MIHQNLQAIILSDDLRADWVKRGRTLLESKVSTMIIMVDNPTWKEDLRANLPSADLLLVAPWLTPDMFIDEELLDVAPKLRAIAGTFDNRFTSFVSIESLRHRRIRLIDTSRSMTPSVAEFALTQTLNLLRDVPAAIALMRAGGWRRPWDTFGYIYGDLAGKKVGLAGYGSINRRYHELLRGFGCPTSVYDPTLDNAAAQRLGLTYTSSLIELAAACEIFVVGIPPLKSSLRHVNKAVFDALPVGGIFVLVSRMAVVDEPALWDAVNTRKLRAAIDVFSTEPVPPDAHYRFHPNVLTTPHIAGGAVYCHERCFADACIDALAVIAGGELRFEAAPVDASMYSGVDQSGRAQQ
ncbi:NAD(P)-dependent oxidoreductase [Bradyrhizobium cajani]|uniref:D-isomer specific 2-hydroxyacid dehydrogenase NAD-binding domain-containing protein n=1 Tax=Bradyrhizobium cajani TaxID=1928661 RepID=A0A844TDF7_9BRAD|nr:NAD(P)-dependent oxidoreductase [Bradyrhizobium cajani]MCP3371824.1 hypothetical protein [Bradyrhizobium cajani]MVT76356.1 hypothetical protein [Bradyrhizobium cajani]